MTRVSQVVWGTVLVLHMYGLENCTTLTNGYTIPVLPILWKSPKLELFLFLFPLCVFASQTALRVSNTKRPIEMHGARTVS